MQRMNGIGCRIDRFNGWYITDITIIYIYARYIFPIVREVISGLGASFDGIPRISYVLSAMTEKYLVYIVSAGIVYYVIALFISKRLRCVMNVMLSIYIVIMLFGINIAVSGALQDS